MSYIETKSKTITELFEEKKYLIVPEYQRKFEWDDDNLMALIMELCESDEASKKALNRVKKYSNPVIHDMSSDADFKKSQMFLGNIVLMDRDIVDGQQRLTSLMLIMKAIAEIAKEYDADFSKFPFINAVSSYVVTKEGGKDCPIIKSNVIGQKGINESLVGLLDKKIGNYKISKLFKKAKSSISETCTTSDRLEHAAFKLLSIQIIVLSLDSIEEAFDVFEKLNSKSTPLAPADLIKNKILSIAHKRNEYEAASQDFLDIFDHLNEFDLTRFIRMVSMIYKAETVSENSKAYVKKNSLYKDVFEKEESDSIMSMFQKIKKVSEVYNDFFVSFPDALDDKHKNLIKRFLDTKKAQVLSTLTLYLSILFNEKKIDEDTYIYLIKWLENYYLRMFTLANNPAKEVDKHIPKIIFEINKLKDNMKIETIKPIFDKFLKPELNEEKDPYRFLLSNTFNNEKSKHLLMKLWDESKTTEEGTVSVIKEYLCHLEHLLPQKPTNWITEYDSWKEYKITGDNGNASKDDDIYNHIFKIGNHFIVRDKANISAGNKVLKDKLIKLESDKIFRAASFVETFDTWNPAQIEERTNKIYNMFKERDILSLD